MYPGLSGAQGLHLSLSKGCSGFALVIGKVGLLHLDVPLQREGHGQVGGLGSLSPWVAISHPARLSAALLYKPVDRVTRSTLVLHVSHYLQNFSAWGSWLLLS